MVDAIAGNTAYENDIEGTRTYSYDNIGNLIAESAPAKDEIFWTVYGKISKVLKADGSSLEYEYDVSGNRVFKLYTKVGGSKVKTWYVRDAQGNMLATYEQKDAAPIFWKEQHLYGSSRLGLWEANMNVALAETDAKWLAAGNKRYELTNHLGNVMAVLSDKKLGASNYRPDVISMQDYYPFGSTMEGRYGTVQPDGSFVLGSGYRYGFNGKENDNEVKGEGNQVAFEARIYDPRLGRFLSRDPLAKKYPGHSDYAYAIDNPIRFIDVYGMGPGEPPTFWERVKIYGRVSADVLNKHLEMTRRKTADKVMPSFLGTLNGIGKTLSFGLYDRSPESIGLNEEYHPAYDYGTFFGQNSPLPGAAGGPGASGVTPVLVVSRSSQVVAKSTELRATITHTLLASSTQDSEGGSNSDEGSSNTGKSRQEKGKTYEDYLKGWFGGRGSFKMKGPTSSREFDGNYVFGGDKTIWYEAKSGNFFEKGFNFEKFKSDIGRGLEVAKHHGAIYQVIAEKEIPQNVKDFLGKKGVSYIENFSQK